MTRSLRSNHSDGDIGLRLNQLEVNIQTVTKQQCIAIFQVRGDFLFKDLLLRGIWRQQHNDVCPLSSLCHGLNLKACFLSLVRRLGTLAQADNNLNAGVTQVLRVCMTLGTVADDGYLAVLNDGQIRIIVIKGLNCHVLILNSVVIESSMNQRPTHYCISVWDLMPT